MSEKRGRGLFTAGAIVLLLLGAVHSISLFTEPPPANDTERQLYSLMSTYKFDLMGSMRSADNLMRGFSLSFVLGTIVMGAVALALRRERAALLQRMSFLYAAWLAAMSVVSLRYFFPAPTSFLVLALLLFALAGMRLRVDH